ncbi:ABC-type transport system involved in multi-copper enzyme maturation permease subunit [Enterococcus sp. PF1-24]|uniref:hypothetical protein n=1 Tax=unclassified Enterococcus TaxID=2608891 RepID=UPI0024767069|nr:MULTISPECIES: hypothetical protein [unclassified Enterococcus]MDH6364103.1 ABC-type transport system involved in multi-copper enzyme maturation permease subunit [Enterococcus sp. PFB1-1]MDH6401204.1 ABC-type transport system involved in multi-copper enzyme maturation permease subunit [Enterococcus sp. PF1-24]
MTSKLIFKMELFKFYRDKSILIIIGILAALNTFFAGSIVYIINNYYTKDLEAFLGLVIFGTLATIVADAFFSLFLPFHMIAMDYKNNVMATMIASGVNRTRLFFSKIGAVFLCSIAIVIAIGFFPAMIFLINFSHTNFWQEFLNGFNYALNLQNTSFPLILLNQAVSYISTLVIVFTTCIIFKGRNIAIIFYFIFNIGIGIVTGILNVISLNAGFDSVGRTIFQICISLIITVIFAFISLTTMRRQNL